MPLNASLKTGTGGGEPQPARSTNVTSMLTALFIRSAYCWGLLRATPADAANFARLDGCRLVRVRLARTTLPINAASRSGRAVHIHLGRGDRGVDLLHAQD